MKRFWNTLKTTLRGYKTWRRETYRPRLGDFVFNSLLLMWSVLFTLYDLSKGLWVFAVIMAVFAAMYLYWLIRDFKAAKRNGIIGHSNFVLKRQLQKDFANFPEDAEDAWASMDMIISAERKR